MLCNKVADGKYRESAVSISSKEYYVSTDEILSENISIYKVVISVNLSNVQQNDMF